MTCSSCQAKVAGLLTKVGGVKKVSIDLTKAEATIEMDKHIPTDILKEALKEYPKYKLSEKNYGHNAAYSALDEEKKTSWVETYKPILLIFFYITFITLLIEWRQGAFLWMRWMNHFMAGFFLIFSFFKFLNLRGFAESYSMYDVVAKRWRPWAYLYAFIELALGVSFLTGLNPFLTNLLTFSIMTVSIIGVFQSVLNKRKIKCACLGDVFNLPMSTITIIEDGLMIGMSAIMLTTLLYHS
jgi:copper chaperone CopZ